ncbi:MAG: glycosyl hydrolase family 95 catalytic domain-containing protein [Draconibacterium sp.]
MEKSFNKISPKILFLTVLGILFFACTPQNKTNNFAGENLVYKDLATVWDEAMPLGNGIIGNLVWQKNGKLRFSLDRADLWDLRPMPNMDFTKMKFKDVYAHWKADDYKKVQDALDAPYRDSPAPSKIPAGALEFDIGLLGPVKQVTLDIKTATCVVDWECGTRLITFVHAEQPVGWYRFENLKNHVAIEMKTPVYTNSSDTEPSRNDLVRLGYTQGQINSEEKSITYNQKGWGNHTYQVHTQWEKDENGLTGCWSVSSHNNNPEPMPEALQAVQEEMVKGFDNSLEKHISWWSGYWAKSSVNIPDTVLQRQYYMDMYKFGSAARADAPPISLQAVWTADNGQLPPWKGDYHHDLNTQLSYWPAYAGNHLDLEEGYINWLWKNRPNFKEFTGKYFETGGINVPGVCTLEGKPMGGWIQYAMNLSISGWLAQHFYLHWKFTGDQEFLEKKAYPWLKEVANYFEQVSIIEDGKRKLPISSSPEIFNNSREAWFGQTTNFDLALIRWTYEKAAEMALELNKKEEAEKWEQLLAEWPSFAVDPETGFMFAPGVKYTSSHRHFSHLLAFHPLGMIDRSKGEKDQQIIQSTIDNLLKVGPQGWCGYSYSWLGNLHARAFNGEGAASALRDFANCFCLRNSFHANGDQSKSGKSGNTSRPFTLEGNFAFAAGIQEMLLQSHTGVVHIFPAIPGRWQNVSFENLRTYGAFLITAERKDGQTVSVEIISEKGGILKLKNPFATENIDAGNKSTNVNKGIITLNMDEGEKVRLTL